MKIELEVCIPTIIWPALSCFSTFSLQVIFLDWSDYFMIAASSKLIACISTYPHEVLRTRLRQGRMPDGSNKYAGLRHAVRTIYREEGLAAFYGGMTAHLMRVVPNSAIMLFCYEIFVYQFKKYQKKFHLE
jgi:Mitochondrial carrier protein